MQPIRGVRAVLIIGFMALLQSCTNQELVIAKNGTSSYSIYYENDKLDSVAFVFQNYIKQISDVTIPIEKNKTNNLILFEVDSSLLKEELQYYREDKNVFIKGGSIEATRNAMYTFLENELNCKWLAPQESLVPEQKDIVLSDSLQYSYIPKITTRTVHSRLFYKNTSFADQHKVTYEAFPNYVKSARVHTFHKFIPEEEFYKSNPEFFSLRGNKRLPTQLCLTNDMVLNMVIDSVSSYFKRNPDAGVLSVSQNDNPQYCECNNCAKIDKEEGSTSGTMIQFVNKVAAHFPEKQISTLAYQYTRKPSKTKPAENVIITLCSIECDRSGPIAEKCTDFADDLIGWGKLTQNIRIWDYTTQFTNFLAPFPNLKTIKPNIQFFSKHNAKWIFEQHSNNPSELFELRSYIMAKLLWNPELDFNELITEFTDAYYGEGAVYVREYIEIIHAELEKNPEFFLFLYGDPSEAFNSYLNKDLLLTYQELFNKAEAAVKGDAILLNRIRKARISIDYSCLEACKKGLSELFSLTTVKGDKKIVNPYVEKMLTQFKKTCIDNDIHLMNEMGFTATEYITNFQKIIAVAIKPNIAKGAKVTLLTKPKKYAEENPQTLTDGALGGNSFYANWLGFEGNNLEAIIDLGKTTEISKISTAFLQVTNHVVFYPEEIRFLVSSNGINFQEVKKLENLYPLTKKSKKNDIQYFEAVFNSKSARYIKIIAKNQGIAPYWHHAAGLPAWIFCDEVLVE